MITAKEAFYRANNCNDIEYLKDRISDEILSACDTGFLYVSISLDKTYNEYVEKAIVEWMEEFGYRGYFQVSEDAASGWLLPTLEISWKGQKDDGNH